MKIAMLLCVFLAVQIPTVDLRSDPYYELWTTQFKAVQLELNILRKKVFEGEKQIATMKADLDQGITKCSTKNVTRENNKAAGNKLKPDYFYAAHILRAFEQEKMYVRRLGERFDDWNKTVVSMSGQIEAFKEQNKETEDSLKNNISSVKRMITEQREELSDDFDKKIQKLNDNLNRLSERLNVLDPIQNDQRKLNERMSQINKSLNDLEVQRCQSGSLEAESYPDVVLPKIFTVKFSPSFKKPPQFMYGLYKLDSTAVLRINVQLITITETYALLKTFTWSDTKLYAAKVRWLACP